MFKSKTIIFFFQKKLHNIEEKKIIIDIYIIYCETYVYICIFMYQQNMESI